MEELLSVSVVDGGRVRLYDLEPPPANFREELLAGLREDPKRIPCKFFYDARGSRLFEEICGLDEYYPTRTELAILRRHMGPIVEWCGPECLLIELGSGSSVKTRLLLDHLEGIAAYMPLDISRTSLLEAAGSLSEAYPNLEILPVCVDYTEPVTLPVGEVMAGKRVVFFPGSTIGNFERGEAEAFLRRVGEWCEAGDGMILGVDLVKDRRVLESAYNDAEGVTAQFNLNLLHRANKELEADFDLKNFEHRAIYNERGKRIEMQLISRAEQRVQLDGETVRFGAGEVITTEYSHKYTVAGVRAMVERAGWEWKKVWTDGKGWFSVHYLEKR